MIDIKFIRQYPELFDNAMRSRGSSFRSQDIIILDEKKRRQQTDIENLKSLRNNFAKEIASLKKVEKILRKY